MTPNLDLIQVGLGSNEPIQVKAVSYAAECGTTEIRVLMKLALTRFVLWIAELLDQSCVHVIACFRYPCGSSRWVLQPDKTVNALDAGSFGELFLIESACIREQDKGLSAQRWVAFYRIDERTDDALVARHGHLATPFRICRNSYDGYGRR